MALEQEQRKGSRHKKTEPANLNCYPPGNNSRSAGSVQYAIRRTRFNLDYASEKDLDADILEKNYSAIFRVTSSCNRNCPLSIAQ